jgi:uncharacterized protein (DUF983 family)
MTSSRNPSLLLPGGPPDSADGLAVSPPPTAASPRAAEKRCPHCHLLWMYSRDIGGESTCVYCGRVEYGTEPCREMRHDIPLDRG